MQTYIQQFELLCSKKELFFQLEELTEQMSLLEVDALAVIMETRQRILQEISVLDEQIVAFCDEDEELRTALNHKCRKQDLSPELAKFYDVSLAIKATANRIVQNDEHIQMHMEFEKKRALEKIQQLNTSGPVVASRYHNSAQTGRGSRPNGFGDKWI